MPVLKRLRLKLKVSDVRENAGGVGMMYIHAKSQRLTVTSLLYERRKGVQYGDERAYVYRMPDGMYADCNHGKW